MMLVGTIAFINELEFAYPVFSSLSAVANIILAALIVFRLVYHRRYIRNTLGVEHGSPYTNIITICVESSALMAITSGLNAILLFVPGYGEAVMMDISPYICVGALELNDF
jgi:hypothetical protein